MITDIQGLRSSPSEGRPHGVSPSLPPFGNSPRASAPVAADAGPLFTRNAAGDLLPRLLRRAIVTCLRHANGCAVSMETLIEWVYCDDPEGGPITAVDGIRHAVVTLRELGMPIKTHFTFGYSMEPLTCR